MIEAWKGHIRNSHTLQLVMDAFDLTRFFGPVFLVLDRYFLSKEVLNFMDTVSERKNRPVEIVTRAKINVTGYLDPVRKPGRGRPPKRGAAVRLRELFNNKKIFQKKKIHIYGEDQTVRFAARKLLWGNGCYKNLNLSWLNLKIRKLF